MLKVLLLLLLLPLLKLHMLVVLSQVFCLSTSLCGYHRVRGLLAIAPYRRDS